MASAALLKREIELKFVSRIPAALSPRVRQRAELQRAADARLSELLGGGVPLGAVTELHGEACSGRTSVATSIAAAVTEDAQFAAWIDVSDEFDPTSAALSGVNLERLVWVRCGGAETKPVCDQALTASDAASGGAQPYAGRKINTGGGSPHPRNEGRGMAEAIDSLLQAQPRSAAMGRQRRARKHIGTPGAQNRDVAAMDAASGHCEAPPGLTATEQMAATSGSLFGRQVSRASCAPHQSHVMPFPQASPYREEQVATDRQPSRRAKAVVRPGSAGVAMRIAGTKPERHAAQHQKKTWAPLDRALRSTDLLLQAGGFSLIVLDLGSVPVERAWRIPLATWFRFRAACDRSRASLLVISQQPCARASADLTVAVQQQGMHTRGERVMTAGRYALHVEQQRPRQPWSTSRRFASRCSRTGHMSKGCGRQAHRGACAHEPQPPAALPVRACAGVSCAGSAAASP